MNTMKVALDIDVRIPDLNSGVPGSDMPVWEYRRKVDATWKPDLATYPLIQPAPLPTRHSNMAVQAVMEAFKIKIGEHGPRDFDALPTKNPIVQVVGKPDSLDLREYNTTEWVSAVWEGQKLISNGYSRPLSPEEYTPRGAASSLFLNTVHYCFAKHYPLGIRPEALMWMVLHEVGVTVKQNSETYRDLFTTEAGKQLIDVTNCELDIHDFSQVEGWAHGIEQLYDELKARIPSSLPEYLLPKISTHDLDSRTASLVAVLDAASPYYDYLMRTCCGIPKIRLFGCAEDYDNIYRACVKLAEIFQAHLGKYFRYLLPVLKEIADTVAGRKGMDNDFWSSIYNHYSGSGTDDMDGWITAFVNYKFIGGRHVEKEAELFDWKAHLAQVEQGKIYGEGIHREDIPNHLSAVPFVWNYAKNHGHQTEGEFAGRNFKLDNGGNGANFDCRLVGGFLAVEDVDGFATPVLSYAVIRGQELPTTVNPDGSWTVQAEGHTPITAQKKSVYAW